MIFHCVMEPRFLDHRAEPVLDLGSQGKKAREVTLLRGSDDHPSSLTDVARGRVNSGSLGYYVTPTSS